MIFDFISRIFVGKVCNGKCCCTFEILLLQAHSALPILVEVWMHLTECSFNIIDLYSWEPLPDSHHIHCETFLSWCCDSNHSAQGSSWWRSFGGQFSQDWQQLHTGSTGSFGPSWWIWLFSYFSLLSFCLRLLPVPRCFLIFSTGSCCDHLALNVSCWMRLW